MRLSRHACLVGQLGPVGCPRPALALKVRKHTAQHTRLQAQHLQGVSPMFSRQVLHGLGRMQMRLSLYAWCNTNWRLC